MQHNKKPKGGVSTMLYFLDVNLLVRLWIKIKLRYQD